MASWLEFEGQAPELAKVARALMEKYRHKVLATLRRDGSPRVSGTETDFRDGELWLGSMAGAVKALDLRRDPRLAIHTTSPAPEPPTAESSTGEESAPEWEGDVKLAGRAVEIIDEKVVAAFELPGTGSHLFRVELTEVAWTRVEGDEVVIDAWHEGRGVRRFRRK
ncbi:pyridoxamine 5'-phosphate oxidase family protein [Nonomuraea sp. 3-1Str]|uniref:pyridoxamine 5'-phosphate oxidase family protein n=1 Tax=Nonomuraea sp. 3-1Str TaxID=2929801 RepID=UPI002866BD29|nr:pyridoxamine 5'-phosphate oxidase family protein [Nonomuraea sp. 3-1Str]MDR8415167.1 pyridoxamine 5'-phosphate oxidase family protein [Nonomuraea sp. 3-1Str]